MVFITSFMDFMNISSFFLLIVLNKVLCPFMRASSSVFCSAFLCPTYDNSLVQCESFLSW